jgi:hypothetical protein
MAAANGTPIRLVQENGGLIELDATSITFTVDRGMSPHSLPAFGGRRFSIDLNKNKSLIVVEGVFADDKQSSGGASASAIMDFSVSQTGATTGDFDDAFVTSANIGNLLIVGDGIVVKNLAGDTFTLGLEQSSGTPGYNTSTDKLRVKNTGVSPNVVITTTQFAQGVADWVNTDVTDMTATVVNSTINQNVSGNSAAVRITQDSTGSSGNRSAYPVFEATAGILDARLRLPHIQTFTGGVDTSAKSAGDKVMDLYGIMNNSSRNIPQVTGFGGALSVLGVGAAPFTAGLSLALLPIGGGLALNSASADGDYIIGIQIPYNSKVQAGGQTYVARNFFMPTGLKKNIKDKSSEGNTLPASTTFDTGDNFTGIQGTVTKMDIFYDAGESVYGFRMDFMPIDAMV